jgi:cytoskeleton-associated protein 5
LETQLASPKWEERKAPLEAFGAVLDANPKLDPSANYGEIVDILKRVISKDVHAGVVGAAAKCMAGLATGLRLKFGPFATNVFADLLDKLKEKKVQVVEPLVKAIEAVAVTVRFWINTSIHSIVYSNFTGST